MRNGKLIVVEGIDGTGKGTVIQAIKSEVEDLCGPDSLVLTKEPGGTPLGRSIRRTMYEDVPTTDMSPNVVDLLFLASHIENCAKVVMPALEAGKIVISDRWWYSQFCYAQLRQVDDSVMSAYDKLKGPPADLALLLVGNSHTTTERARSRESETHQSTKAWNDAHVLGKIQDEYIKLAFNRDEFVIINIDGKGVGAVSNEVIAEVRRLMEQQ